MPEVPDIPIREECVVKSLASSDTSGPLSPWIECEVGETFDDTEVVEVTLERRHDDNFRICPLHHQGGELGEEGGGRSVRNLQSCAKTGHLLRLRQQVRVRVVVFDAFLAGAAIDAIGESENCALRQQGRHSDSSLVHTLQSRRISEAKERCCCSHRCCRCYSGRRC